MGNSIYQGKEWTKAFVEFHKHEIQKICDIGPGQGTYYHILNSDIPDRDWTGIEAFLPYINQFSLTSFYQTILNKDIRKYKPVEEYDLVIAGDVLEHMRKEEAIEVVQKFMPLCKYFLISIPIIHWPQDAINNNPFEVHVKDDWSDQEIRETFDNVIYSFVGSHIGVYVLQGNLK